MFKLKTKQFLLYLISIIFIFSMYGCNNNNNKESDTQKNIVLTNDQYILVDKSKSQELQVKEFFIQLLETVFNYNINDRTEIKEKTELLKSNTVISSYRYPTENNDIITLFEFITNEDKLEYFDSLQLIDYEIDSIRPIIYDDYDIIEYKIYYKIKVKPSNYESSEIKFSDNLTASILVDTNIILGNELFNSKTETIDLRNIYSKAPENIDIDIDNEEIHIDPNKDINSEFQNQISNYIEKSSMKYGIKTSNIQTNINIDNNKFIKLKYSYDFIVSFGYDPFELDYSSNIYMHPDEHMCVLYNQKDSVEAEKTFVKINDSYYKAYTYNDVLFAMDGTYKRAKNFKTADEILNEQFEAYQKSIKDYYESNESITYDPYADEDLTSDG